ncbi:peptidoglycan-binding domain-containing protein [Bacillus glycinifermentans]
MNGLDSIFGSGLEKAVKSFQRAKGLSTDGIVGKATWTKLFA